MTTPGIRVHPIRSQDTQVLRHRVLWPHKPSPEACVLPVDDDPGAVPLGAWKHEEVSWGIRVPGLPGPLVGACSLFQQHCDRVSVPWQEGDDLRLRVMGTLPKARGMGAGLFVGLVVPIPMLLVVVLPLSVTSWRVSALPT